MRYQSACKRLRIPHRSVMDRAHESWSMVNPEQRDNWSELVRRLDELPLAELARRYGGKPGQIVAALQRTGVVRGTGVSADDDLPPEAGESLGAPAPVLVTPPPSDDASTRMGSKDGLIARHAAALGSVPDAELAERAGVSVRTVASYRARHGIPGFRGPGRPPAAPRPAVAVVGAGRKAWTVTLRRGATVLQAVVIADDIQSAIVEAERSGHGAVESVAFVGPVRTA